MEESERTVKCAIDENIETKNFDDELVDFPHIVEYIQKLQEQLQKQQDDICELKNKLNIYEKQYKESEKSFTDNETQCNLLELQEKPLLQEWTIDNDKKNSSIADQVTEAAESAMLQTGFVYEETTGLYYHYSSGYYYDSKSGLYYNGNTGTYYYYDKESKSYKFHSQLHREANEFNDLLPKVEGTERKNKKEKDRMKKVKLMQDDQSNDDITPEEDECTDTEDQESLSSKEDITKSSSGNNSETEKDEDVVHHVYPPCMRIIVKETKLSNLKVGSLFIVTYTGGSLGREGDHSVLITDINISKHHAKLQYNKEEKLYEIIDLGSRNGTFLNGKRLSAAKQESEVTKIVHGSILQVGSTKLLCHIHNGHETCGHCEPGLLLSDTVIEDNVTSIKIQHQLELKRLKYKFGIEQNNTDTASRVALGYRDRAQLRRENIGSSSDYIKTQQSSINEFISKDNMGFKMLMKMGWSEGNSLGKRGDGVTEPITLVPVINKAGFGSTDNQINAAQNDSNSKKKKNYLEKNSTTFQQN